MKSKKFLNALASVIALAECQLVSQKELHTSLADQKIIQCHTRAINLIKKFFFDIVDDSGNKKQKRKGS